MPLVKTSIVLFNRDLRVHDHEGLRRAGDFGQVIPLFVLDDKLRATLETAPNRARFLAESLADLAERLDALGAPLVVRCGDPGAVVDELVSTYEAEYVFTAADYTPVARRREASMAATLTGGVAVVAPGVVVPANGDRYKVFTPYYNRWVKTHRGKPLAAPRKLKGIDGVASDDWAWLRQIEPTATDLAKGGESAGRAQLAKAERRVGGYAEDGHNDLAGDRSSRMESYECRAQL